MADYTLSQIRSLIDATCFPPSASSSTKNTLINKVREAFYYTPEQEGGGNALWKGSITEQTINVINQFADAQGIVVQTITLPRSLSTVLKAKDKDGPIEIRNEWDQFGRAGYWGARMLGDLGDGFCGVTDISSSGATMKITTTSNEGGALTVVFTGTDVNGNVLSETVNIPTVSGNSASTSNLFYSITEVIKSTTVGYLVCNQTTSGTDTFFARYEPSENFPSYRRYQYAFKTLRTTVDVKAKRQFYNLASDSEPVEFGSVMAFEQGLKAYRWFQANDMQNYRNGMVEAISYLNGEQSAYESESAEGTIQLQRVTSGGDICNIL